MILLELNPLSTPVAVTEIVVALSVAAIIGYLLGRWITKGQYKELQQVLVNKETELGDCKALQSKPVPQSVAKAPGATLDTSIVRDDLKKIEGIGPGIEKLLNAEKIFSFAQLAMAPQETLKEILRNGGPRFQIHDPQTWPQQASLAKDEKWEELSELQERLTGGREPDA